MKSYIYSLISYVNSLIYRRKLTKTDGTHFIDPKPKYLSQFVGIYPQSITPQTILKNKKHIATYGAENAEEFSFWVWRNCGIACVKMILENKKKAKNKTIMDLTKEGIDLGGYILYEGDTFVDKGWFHNSLVALLQKYGVTAKSKKWQSIESVAVDILKNKFVILSVQVPVRQDIYEDGSFRLRTGGKLGGHLLLATGLKMFNNKVEGVFVHDSRGLEKYQKDTYIPAEVFNTIFSHRTVIVEDTNELV